MKLKLRLNQKTILEFLLQNVEKMGVGIVVFIFLLMVYSALTGVERYHRTPDQLTQAVKSGRETIERTPMDTGLTVRNYVAQAKRSRAAIEKKPYTYPVFWDPALFPKPPLRGTPALLAARDLRGSAATGAMRSAAARGENEVRGQRWIVLTGLVPVEEQELAFDELKNSVFHDPKTDCPEYLGYWVQRLEMTSPDEAASPDWEKAQPLILSRMAIKAAKKQWGQSNTAEVIPAKYIKNWLVFPLGPLVGRSWDKSVAHPPEIPLRSVEKSGGGGAGGRTDPGPAMPKGGAGRTGPGGHVGPGFADNLFGGDYGRPIRPRRDVPPKPVKSVQEKKPPKRLLFRYFDFNVAPGKHYVYRVRLALQNPNEGLKSAYLKDPKLAQQSFLATKWSDPSPVISVPRDTRVLAVSVKPARSNNDLPSGQILVTKWVQSKGIEAFKDFQIVCGQIANFPNETFRPAAGGAFKVNYFSQVIAIDFRGGQRLPGQKGSNSLGLTAVGEMLLLDADGNLMVRNELDDKPTRNQVISGDQTGATKGKRPGLPSRGGLESLPR